MLAIFTCAKKIPELQFLNLEKNDDYQLLRTKIIRKSNYKFCKQKWGRGKSESKCKSMK